jgi:hypothetical protein
MSKRQNSPNKTNNDDEIYKNTDENVNLRIDEEEDLNDDEMQSTSTRGQLEDLQRQIEMLSSRFDSAEREKRALAKENRHLRREMKARSDKPTRSMERMPVAGKGQISSKAKIVPKIASSTDEAEQFNRSMRSMLKKAQSSGYKVSRKQINVAGKGTNEQKKSLMKELLDYTMSGKSVSKFTPQRDSNLRIPLSKERVGKRFKSSNDRPKTKGAKRMRLTSDDVHEGDLAFLKNIEDLSEKEEDDEAYVEPPDEHYDNLKKHDDDNHDDDEDEEVANQMALTLPLQIPKK